MSSFLYNKDDFCLYGTKKYSVKILTAPLGSDFIYQES